MKHNSRNFSLKSQYHAALLTLLILLASLGFCPTPALAQWAVVDNANLAQAVQQFEEMKKQYEMMKQQFEELQKMKNSLTGSFGMGSLLNEVKDLEGRRPLPKTWQEVVSLQGQGFYGQKLGDYQKLLPKIDLKLIHPNSKDPYVTSYARSKDQTAASFAATEAVYNQLEERLKSIEALVAQIDQTPNVKAALDLNTRMVAETGFISLDLARLNALQLNLQATLQHENNLSLEKNAKFFAKPNQ